VPSCQDPWREDPNEWDDRLGLLPSPDAITLPEQIAVTASFEKVGIHTRTFDLSRHQHKVLVEL
jgi:hypothetical protein